MVIVNWTLKMLQKLWISLSFGSSFNLQRKFKIMEKILCFFRCPRPCSFASQAWNCFKILHFLAEESLSVSGSRSAFSSIALFHRMSFRDDISPTNSWQVLKSITNRFAKPVVKALPITSLDLQVVLDFFFFFKDQ